MNLRFPGQLFDGETGLHYNYFRDYDPSIGRYVESDPIGLAAGPNTYAYAGANPLNASDATGLLTRMCPNDFFQTQTWQEHLRDVSQIAGGAAVGASVAQYASGAATLGSNLRFYSNWAGNQYVSTVKLSKLAEGLGTRFIVFSAIADFGLWNQGDLSTEHLSVNLTMDAVGIFGGPVGALVAGAYYRLDTFYPGVAEDAINNLIPRAF
jgi:RHS repeat-associated protein